MLVFFMIPHCLACWQLSIWKLSIDCLLTADNQKVINCLLVDSCKLLPCWHIYCQLPASWHKLSIACLQTVFNCFLFYSCQFINLTDVNWFLFVSCPLLACLLTAVKLTAINCLLVDRGMAHTNIIQQIVS